MIKGARQAGSDPKELCGASRDTELDLQGEQLDGFDEEGDMI